MVNSGSRDVWVIALDASGRRHRHTGVKIWVQMGGGHEVGEYILFSVSHRKMFRLILTEVNTLFCMGMEHGL